MHSECSPTRNFSYFLFIVNIVCICFFKNFEIFPFADLLNKYLTNKIDEKYRGMPEKKKQENMFVINISYI